MIGFSTEKECKHLLRKRWGGWTDTTEPALGSGVGIPDLFALISKGNYMEILPIEVKLGRTERNRVFASHVRPSQVRWHYNFADHGGVSALVVGISEEEAYLIHGSKIVDWKIGFAKKDCERIFFAVDTELSLQTIFSDFFKFG